MTSDAAFGCGLAALFVLVAFVTTGGTDLGPNTWMEIAAALLAAAAAAAVIVIGAPGRAWGGVTLLLFAALAALTFASIAWSVQPDNSWVEANRTVAYLAAFGTALALARLLPERWPALLGALATAATVICAWALLVKVFPGSLDANDPVARLRAPFDYWNATGLLAAMGLAPCIWAGARPSPGRILRALSVPALAILTAVVVLSYSRGALIAAIVACGCWFAFVPLRLRAALILGLGAAGGAVITVWALTHHALTHDNATLAARTAAGHTFGVVVLVVVVLLAGAGYAAAVAMDRRAARAPGAPPHRSRADRGAVAGPDRRDRVPGELLARADRRGVARVGFADQHQRGGHRDSRPAGRSLQQPAAVLARGPQGGRAQSAQGHGRRRL